MKKYFKILWRSLLGLAAVVIVLVGMVLLIKWCRYQNNYYTERELSDNVTVRWYYHKSEYRLYNSHEKKTVLKGIDKVVKPARGDSLTVFFQDGLRGYLNANTGKSVIPAQYSRAWLFSEGIAAVMDSSGKIGFVDKDNKVVLPFVYSSCRGKNVDYLFHNGLCVMTDLQGTCGLIDVTGSWALAPKYDYIWSPRYGKYRIVIEDGKYGVLDESLSLLFPIEYDFIEFANSEADGLLLIKDGVKQQVAFDGTVLVPFMLDDASDLYYTQRIESIVVPDGEGSSTLYNEVALLSDYLQYCVHNSWGLMHRETGKVILPALYNDIEMLSSTLVKAELAEASGYILFDVNGQRIE